jgi:hypothetical protein
MIIVFLLFKNLTQPVEFVVDESHDKVSQVEENSVPSVDKVEKDNSRREAATNSFTQVLTATHDIVIDDELRDSINYFRGSFALKNDENIYFSKFDSESLLSANGEFYSLNIKDLSIHKIADIAARFLKYHEQKIYFINVSDSARLYTYDLESKEIELISSESGIMGFEVIDDWIYVLNRDLVVERTDIGRINLTSKEYEEIITNQDCTNLIYYEESLYYTNMGDRFELTKINLENFETSIIFYGYYMPYGIVNDKVIMENSGPRLLDLNSNKIFKLVDYLNSDEKPGINQFNFYKDSIIYTDLSQKIVLHDGFNSKVIFDEFPVGTFTLVGDWLFINAYNDETNSGNTSLIIMNLLTEKQLNY